MKKHILLPLSLALFLVFTAYTISGTGGDYLFIDKGDTEELELDADTYNGYEWVISGSTDETIVKYEGKEFEYGSKNTDLSVQKLKFKGLKKGKTTITLQYIKQGEQLPKKTKTVKIQVF
jgi:hypothetical protein